MVSFFDVAISLRKVSRQRSVVGNEAESFVGGVEDRRLSFLSPSLSWIVKDLGTRSLVGGVVLYRP